MRHLFETYFTPLVVKKSFHWIVTILVGIFFISGIIAIINLPLGIDQKASVSTGSDIYNYFMAQEKLGDAGPPSYLIFRDIDYTDQKTLSNIFDLLDVSPHRVIQSKSQLYLG